MTEEQLKYFITVVDTGSYMETALELNITQSSVSKQIQALEHELGVQLFNRKHRRVKLTIEGKRLLPQARHTLDEIYRLEYMSKKLQPGYKDKITVLSLPIIGNFHLYIPMSRFELENPSFLINLVELEEPRLFHRLQNNSFDIALTYWYGENLDNSKTLFIPAAEDEIVLAVHKDTPLAKLHFIFPEQLKNSSLMLMEPYTCISNLCMAFFDEHDIAPDIIFRGRPETILSGVEANYGVALITRKLASNSSFNNVVLIPFSPSISITLGAFINKHSQKNPKINELVNMLIAKMANDKNKS
ncbi:LysR family transcriptional regulator [Clostridium ljungdahlii]|uniref:Hydrogen peroxide-inducible genes activator n=1 Tax=Clostridium ljungdahlii (strain ATCC 55383 / DSM 13528 / PETC) TaxID=748727 RepID=D8GM27_CLOLD|nr:LysR family transcriptional regulator [Clostridium ljungdahlii]ADK15601.1 transcriptional regulator [Clostridium ljungdahlii DSM 13528]OAA86482.1 Hydrogen peroxide-inducible genes activator [Clostridium ljungdahlii DSM 13528]